MIWGKDARSGRGFKKTVCVSWCYYPGRAVAAFFLQLQRWTTMNTQWFWRLGHWGCCLVFIWETFVYSCRLKYQKCHLLKFIKEYCTQYYILGIFSVFSFSENYTRPAKRRWNKISKIETFYLISSSLESSSLFCLLHLLSSSSSSSSSFAITAAPPPESGPVISKWNVKLPPFKKQSLYHLTKSSPFFSLAQVRPFQRRFWFSRSTWLYFL